MKKINLRKLEETLSPKEMKNILGGSNSVCPSDYPYPVRCSNGDLRCYKTSGNSC